jgi:outer membrane protein TolC
MPTSLTFLTHFYDGQATLVVPLSDYVLRFPKLIDAARLGEDAARTNWRSAEAAASAEARLTYYEWVRARLQVLIAQRQLVEVRATLGQIRALAEVQRVSKAELLRVESQEAQAEQIADQLKNLADLREEQLRLEIGASAEEPLTMGEDIRKEVLAPHAAPLDDLTKHATQHRLELHAIDVGIAAKDKQRDVERANGYPKLAAVGFVEDANPNPRAISFSQADVFTLTWQVGLQVTWQLPDTLNAEMNRRRLIAEADELRADRENFVRGTRIEVLAAQQAMTIAQHALQTTQKGLVAAQEGYRVRRELLNAERATAVELVDAETDLTRARIAALNARVDLRVALAQLAHALGDDVSQP